MKDLVKFLKNKKNNQKCFCCKKEFYFDDTHIPIGEKYEVSCPYCASRVWHRKY